MATTDPAGQPPPSGGFAEGGWYSGYQYSGGRFPALAGQLSTGEEAFVSEADKSFIAAQRIKTPQPQTSSAVTPSLNDFQNQLFQAVDAPRVKERTAEEIRALVTPPVRPELLDRIGMFEDLREEQGIVALEAALNDLTAQEDEIVASARQRGQAEEGKPVALGVIGGRQTEIQRQENEKLDFVQRQKARVVDQLRTANNTVSLYMNLHELNYQDASERFNADFNANLQIYNLITAQEERILEQFERDRNHAKSNLQVYANAITNGNLSYSNLPVDQQLAINKMEVQSGLPVGFISDLRLSPKDSILYMNEKTGEALVIGEDGNMQIQQTGFRGSVGTGTKETESERKQDAFSQMDIILNELGGDDNFVSPDEWNTARSRWVQKGFNKDDFDAAFRIKHVGVDVADRTNQVFDLDDFGLE